MVNRLRVSFAALSALAALAGCGGNVILDHGTGGAAGGSAVGGDTATTTTYPTTTYDTTTPTYDTTTPTYDTTTVTTSITETATITTGQWGGTATCDNSGDCGDSNTGCISCSFASDCSVPYNNCIQFADCTGYSDCLANCNGGDQACYDDCGMQYQVGALLYNDLVQCVLCWSCLNDCAVNGGCQN